MSQLVRRSLPLPEGERVVGIRLWHAESNREEPRSLHDFASRRGELRAVRELGAFRTLERNLVTGAGEAEPVRVAG